MSDPHATTAEFEYAVARYCGAPFAVATTSCTTALLIALKWWRGKTAKKTIVIPRFTYVGVAQSVRLAGFELGFVADDHWSGSYCLFDSPVWDSARRFTSGMYRKGQIQCLSFHWSKHLGIGQGGMILTDNTEVDDWCRRARFDGRQSGVAPKDDRFTWGVHAYMMPRDAAEGLTRLALLPKHNEDLPWSGYADLSEQPEFR